MLEINQAVTVDGTSGNLLTVQAQAGAVWTAVYVQASTIASTWSFTIQTGISSAGPWVTEASTSISATGTATSVDVLRLTGAYEWLRAYTPTKSTGTHVVKIVAVGPAL